MKKFMMSVAVLAVLVSVFVFAGMAYAQSANPPVAAPDAAYGRGGMMGGRGGMMAGGRGGMMSAYGANVDQDGPMHDTMVAALAEKLGLSVEDINTRLANGETMYQIAASKGLSTADLQALMSDVRAKAIDEMVKDGTLTQEQADWMKQRGGMMGGAGRGGMMGGRGMHGTGAGTNPDCPFGTQVTP